MARKSWWKLPAEAITKYPTVHISSATLEKAIQKLFPNSDKTKLSNILQELMKWCLAVTCENVGCGLFNL